MTKNVYKLQKKQLKQQHKLEKKHIHQGAGADPEASSSLFVRFAESIRGTLYIILAISIIAAVIMGQSGLIITLEDIIDNLLIASLGKILIIIIAVALFIYGLKNLRIMK